MWVLSYSRLVDIIGSDEQNVRAASTMYSQHPTIAADDGTNPAACVSAGRARIPAPTVVPPTWTRNPEEAAKNSVKSPGNCVESPKNLRYPGMC